MPLLKINYNKKLKLWAVKQSGEKVKHPSHIQISCPHVFLTNRPDSKTEPRAFVEVMGKITYYEEGGDMYVDSIEAE